MQLTRYGASGWACSESSRTRHQIRSGHPHHHCSSGPENRYEGVEHHDQCVIYDSDFGHPRLAEAIVECDDLAGAKY